MHGKRFHRANNAARKNVDSFMKGRPDRAIEDIAPNVKWRPERKPRKRKVVSLPKFSWDN